MKVLLNTIICSSLLAVSGLIVSCSDGVTYKEARVVPKMLEVEKGSGYFSLSPNTVISISSERQRFVADWFSSLFTVPAGFTPRISISNSSSGAICLVEDDTMKEEAYEMDITSDRIQIKAADNRGFFYALQSLRLMLPATIEGGRLEKSEWNLPVMKVKDEPRFAYRGFMLDVARFFMPKEDLLRMIDCMAMLKLNKLHLHLTDDNGWRLEIKKYPRLTEVGAWRVDRQNLPFPNRRNPEKGETATIGGYYTQEEMKEVIAYAVQRQVEVIPEIDIPAHSNAALAAYPELACPVVDHFIGVLPGLGGNNAEVIFCAGNENSFKFLKGVLDEVIDLFPSRYIHLGGDEANKNNWKKCPLCQTRIRKEHLTDEEALQGYFMGRMSDYVRSKGKEVMGWDELTNTKLPKDVIVFGWQGLGTAALKAARQGHRFVMTPARIAYLIRYQGPQWFEPLTYFGNNTLKDLYMYEPIQDNWKPEYESLLMGVQASMWTEFCDKPADVFYQVFPRLAALAELVWAPKGYKDWNIFLDGLDNYLVHLDNKGVVYSKAMYNIQHIVYDDSLGQLRVKLECERPDVEIRYTLDGTEPVSTSALYKEELVVTGNTTIKAATFKQGSQAGKVLVLPLKWNKATAKPLVKAQRGMEVLVNGLRGSLKQTDFEWYTGALLEPFDVTLDLGKETILSQCVIGCVTNYGMGVHKPRRVCVEISSDNINFANVGELVYTDNEIFKEGNFIEDLKVQFETVKARYVRISFEVPGRCPLDHVRPGQPSRIYLDEIMIE